MNVPSSTPTPMAAIVNNLEGYLVSSTIVDDMIEDSAGQLASTGSGAADNDEDDDYDDIFEEPQGVQAPTDAAAPVVHVIDSDNMDVDIVEGMCLSLLCLFGITSQVSYCS